MTFNSEPPFIVYDCQEAEILPLTEINFQVTFQPYFFIYRMKDPINSYCRSLEPIEETDFEDSHPITEIESKHNNLNDRVVALKAITDSLKEQIQSEKELWNKELEETIKLEKEIQKKREAQHKMITLNEGEFKRKMEIFRDFVFFCQANNHLEKLVKKNNYSQWLAEVENECETELDKIQQSLTALRPLQEIVSSWNKEKPFQNPGLKYLDDGCKTETNEVLDD